MTEQSQTIASASENKDTSALECEAEHGDTLMNSGPGPSEPQSEDVEKQENQLRVEQDNRAAQVKAEAKEADTGGEEPKGGVNPDG